MNLYIIRSEHSPVKQVIANDYGLAIDMYLNTYPDIEGYELDVNEIGQINGCINGTYMISTSCPQWSEENRIEE